MRWQTLGIRRCPPCQRHPDGRPHVATFLNADDGITQLAPGHATDDDWASTLVRAQSRLHLV